MPFQAVTLTEASPNEFNTGSPDGDPDNNAVTVDDITTSTTTHTFHWPSWLDTSSTATTTIAVTVGATTTTTETATATPSSSSKTLETSDSFTNSATPTATGVNSVFTATSENRGESDGGGGGGGGGLSNSTKIAIAVPVAVVGAAIIAAILFFFFIIRRRRQRKPKPEISSPKLDMGPSVFLTAQMQTQQLLESQPQPQPQPRQVHGISESFLPVPIPATIPRRPVPQRSTSEQARLSEQAAPTPVAVVRDHDALEWRTSEERGDRPRSPFDHPLDGAMSDISGMSDREDAMHTRGLADDLSSVSSFEDDDDRRPHVHR